MQINILPKRPLRSVGKPHPKSQFSVREDTMLKTLVDHYGENAWELISQLMVSRNVRQCRERYTKYLSPEINKSPWTKAEDNLLWAKYKELGPKWMKISKFFNSRTDAAIKNRWHILVRQRSNGFNSFIVDTEDETPEAEEIDPIEKIYQGFEACSRLLEEMDGDPFAIW